MAKKLVPKPSTLATHKATDSPVIVIGIDEYDGSYITETFNGADILGPPNQFILAPGSDINNVPIIEGEPID